MSDDWLHRYKNKIIFRVITILALTLCGASIVIIMLLRSQLINETSTNTKQMASAITSNLRTLMLANASEKIQQTLDNISSDKSISTVFIIDTNGRIAYSSNPADVGNTLNRASDESCRGCHDRTGAPPKATSIVISSGDTDSIINSGSFLNTGIFRSINVIRNEPACHSCHPKNTKIIGKVIVDRSLESAFSLIRSIEFIIVGSGIIGLLLVIPLLSRVIGRYIDQILLEKQELTLVYSIIDSISKTIEIDELTRIVLDITQNMLSAEEVDIVLPKGDDYRILTNSLDGEHVDRKKLDQSELLAEVIVRWKNGGMHSLEVSADRMEMYLPIEMNGHRLGLIVARRRQSTLLTDRLDLVEAVGKHFAIAFENARLYSIAITDELTGLFTVRYFRTCLDRQMESLDQYGERFTLLVIDLDNFKRVNDSYGHVFGDAVLKHVARCISDSVRLNDLVFRYGGEEFTVILPSTGTAGGLHVAERIRAQVETSNIELPDGNMLTNTVSIGMAVCPDNVGTLKELMLEADKALYRAKHAGKNQVKGVDS